MADFGLRQNDRKPRSEKIGVFAFWAFEKIEPLIPLGVESDHIDYDQVLLFRAVLACDVFC